MLGGVAHGQTRSPGRAYGSRGRKVRADGKLAPLVACWGYRAPGAHSWHSSRHETEEVLLEGGGVLAVQTDDRQAECLGQTVQLWRKEKGGGREGACGRRHSSQGRTQVLSEQTRRRGLSLGDTVAGVVLTEGTASTKAEVRA